MKSSAFDDDGPTAHMMTMNRAAATPGGGGGDVATVWSPPHALNDEVGAKQRGVSLNPLRVDPGACMPSNYKKHEQ
jgi:hypothetical protein